MAHTIEGYLSGDSSTKSQKYHNVNWIEESTTVNLIGIITPFTKILQMCMVGYWYIMHAVACRYSSKALS